MIPPGRSIPTRVDQGPQDLRRDLRGMSSRAGQRPRVRYAVSGQEFLDLASFAKGRRRPCAGRGPEGRGRNGHRSGPGPCPDAAYGQGAGFSRSRSGARSCQAWGCSDVPASTSADMPFAIALMIIVEKTSEKWMEDHHLTDEQKQALWRSRKNCPNPGDAKETHYRARPLNGVWATAPYLHNGSVPSLYWMLKPAAERPKQFCMGTRDFDPQQVGFHVEPGEKPACRHGETLFCCGRFEGIADSRQQQSRPFAGGNAGARQTRRHRPPADRRRALRPDRIFEDAVGSSNESNGRPKLSLRSPEHSNQLERFRAKWKPVRVKKTRQTKTPEPGSDSSEPNRL